MSDTNKRWSDMEIAIVKKYYQKGGVHKKHCKIHKRAKFWGLTYSKQ